MSNTSLSDMVTIFNNVSWSFHYVILPICFILGNVGNCLNLILFSRRSSRSCSCLLYFLSASTINIFILNFSLVLRILRGIWSIDPTPKFLWFCRWRTYFLSNCFLIYRYSILLACVDRMCASSRSARIRRISQPKVAYRLIAGLWIFITIYYTPSLVFPVLISGQCLSPPGSTFATYATGISLAQGLFIPSAMILCGLITIRHLKLMKAQVVPLNPATADERRAVGQYLMMLFVQVAADCLGNITYPCYIVVSLIYPEVSRLQNGAISSFVLTTAVNMPHVYYSAGFYLYTLSSATFRRKFLHILRQNTWFRRFLPLHHQGQNTQTMTMITMRAGNTVAINPVTARA